MESYEWVEKTKESCVTKVKNNNGEKVKITEKKEHIVRHFPNSNSNPALPADSVTAAGKSPEISKKSPEKARASSSPVKTPFTAKPAFSQNHPVPTKIWDQPMFKNTTAKTGETVAPKKPAATATTTTSSATVESKDSVWDFLNKNRGIQGYGGKAVNSWGGEKSGVAQQMDAGRKTLDDPVDSEDEEMDRGKVKKVKKKNNPISAFHNAFGFKGNPFQKRYESNAKKL